MFEHLFSHIDIDPKNVHIPHNNGDDLDELAREYNDLLDKTHIDLQIWGIGSNGHIGFNEPGTSFDQETFIVTLDEQTRKDNARFFKSYEDVPTHAITMGIKNIMKSKKIILLAIGKNKAKVIHALIHGPVTTDIPATILQKHHDVTMNLDE